ncbi:MAG TPA: MATE family efflux transporter, partial [Actinoplanes sp.]|nr:MATE family efflux transporter [Actinoplanes sp.]
ALGGADSALARDIARRVTLAGGLCGLALAILALAGSGALPALFTSDRAVHDQLAVVWPWFVGLLPPAAVVYALDGVLIGAGDVRYLRDLTLAAALGGFLPAIWAAKVFGLGLGGVWAGLAVFTAVRLVTLLWRLRSGRWVVVGATR